MTRSLLELLVAAKNDLRATKRILYDMDNFLMPRDQVMAFLCFITDSQLVDMSAQVICVRNGEVVGGHKGNPCHIEQNTTGT